MSGYERDQFAAAIRRGLSLPRYASPRPLFDRRIRHRIGELSQRSTLRYGDVSGCVNVHGRCFEVGRFAPSQLFLIHRYDVSAFGRTLGFIAIEMHSP